MAEKPPSDAKTAQGQDQQFSVAAPQLSLPKGGGAIRGIGEKFAANPVTGTGSLTVPIYASPGRSGFGPQLSLSYDSGSGNSPFGFGWSLALPAITRKTDKGLPKFFDSDESDVFILSGAEDLMPGLVRSNGQWVRDPVPPRVPPRTVYGKPYAIHRYRPRVEGLFARIERWINLSDPQDTFWRSISKDNITTWYGKTPESRIADPADPSRVFSWMICESYDDKGNVVSYRYKTEDSAGVDLAQAHERNRSDPTRSAKKYIKYIFYGNRTPYFPDLTAAGPVALPSDEDWCFELVFDYGEHDRLAPVPKDTGSPPWHCRLDPFSSYRATFEVRTYRLCRRVLMFHHFADDPTVGTNCLVRSTHLHHSSAPPADPSQPFYSYLLSVTQAGHVRDPAGGYITQSLPAVQFEYTQAEIDETVRDVDSESLKNLPYGMDGSNYRWVDLDGEGLSGILTEQGGSWLYKPNLSPVNQQVVNGEQLTLPEFGPMQGVAFQPSLASLGGGRQQLMDLSGDGKLDLVQFDGPTPGFFERTENADWEPFQAFQSLPVLDWRNPNLKFIDVTGDGFPDLLISEDDAFWWHESHASEGFGAAQRAAQSWDEEKGPRLVFADGTESVFLADLSGDGLTDLMRIRLGEVCYWPNLGYGRFGAKVTMDRSPWFDRADLFDGRRIRLADIDGAGNMDIIYFASDEVRLYFNQSGNAWGTTRALRNFPQVESVSSAMALDLLGNGTACLAWSSPLPGNARRPMRYIDLMGGQKPHLLVRQTNNLGAETIVQYAPSTKFYVTDKLAGTPWLTRLPFPVHVVERVESYDYVSRNRFVTRYAYHHGYYDGVEREFRGFGRVDQWDTEEIATLSNASGFPQPSNEDPASNLPPTLTKTWFHTGAYFGESAISRHLEGEYYSEGDSSDAIAGLTPAQLEAMLLADTVLPSTILLADGTRIPYDFSGEEMREACRALRGSILRQEIYALDNSDESDRPYSVSERNYTLEVLQPQGPNRYGVFFAHPRETVDFHYERKLYVVANGKLVDPTPPPAGAKSAADPRVTHALTLKVDPFGNVLKSVAIGYGRRYSDPAFASIDPALTAADQLKQNALLSTYTENLYTNAVLADDAYRAPLPAQSSTYELIQLQPGAAQPGITNLFRLHEVRTQVKQASDSYHDILYENLDPTGLNTGEVYRRLVACVRTYYRPDDMGAAPSPGDPNLLLGLGKLESLALPGSSYKLAFTPGLIPQVYQRSGAALLPTPAAVLGSVNADGGGYFDLDGDGRWWAPSGRVFYFPAPTSSGAEKTEALQHFFVPRRFEDPFGNTTSVDYDAPDLLVVQTTDAAGNTVTSSNDYRVLAPFLLTDPNGSNAEVRFDALAMVVGTAVYKGTTLGDSFATFAADLDQTQIDGFYAAFDPHKLAGGLLGTATTRIVYDVKQFFNTRQASPTDPTKWLPVFAATIARETHVSDPVPDPQRKFQITFSYSDGFGREIQKKIQSEPGPVVDNGPVVDPRWVGSGWTIFNNKGKPVRQYEPFFSQLPTSGHQFEFGVQVGVSPILCYDPVERVVATLHPNHTYEKVVFDPWHQDSWDANDTVLQTDPTADPDAGDFFQLLPSGDYTPTWYTQRIAGGLGPQEQDSASKAAAHANTPTTAYFDTLGRTFLTVFDNAAAGKYPSRVELDIQGNQRFLRDAIVQAGDPQGRIVMRYDYDLLKTRIHQSSMEAGERWTLNDFTGKGIRSWDSRGHNFRTEYDALRRPTGLFVLGTDNANSDPRTTAGEVLYDKTIYGEGQPAALNLSTRVFQHWDAAGVVTNQGINPVTQQAEGFDFKGNLLRSSRGFFPDYKALPDLTAPPPTPDLFASSTQYDALNRPITLTTPDGSVTVPAYNARRLLQAVSVTLAGSSATTPAPFVTDIEYNAKGQRESIAYGNGAATAYDYDPHTFRLVHLLTKRDAAAFPGDCPEPPPAGWPGCQAQNLSYTYDPVGNITYIRDDAQQTIYFNNQRVEPSNDYTYDSLYRLIDASGREHIGQLAAPQSSWNDEFRVNLAQPGDGQAMRNYTEQYSYDAVGNFEQLIHQATNGNWTRVYSYTEWSLIEPKTKYSNRLSSTTVGGFPTEPYAYDAHGNMNAMPQLTLMQWDYKDQLSATSLQTVNATPPPDTVPETTYYVYDAGGQRVRKVTERQNGTRKDERIYLGGFEVYRKYDGTGANVTLERETLHIMDDMQRIALVESLTQGSDGSPQQLIRYQYGNHLGSAVLELDDKGNVISYEEYYPYGSTSYQAVDQSIKAAAKRYQYTGKERDEESGLYYHGARYYIPWLGTWTAADPAGIKSALSLYTYCSGNPSCYMDNDGRQALPPTVEETSPILQLNSLSSVTASSQSGVHSASFAGNADIAEHRSTVGANGGRPDVFTSHATLLDARLTFFESTSSLSLRADLHLGTGFTGIGSWPTDLSLLTSASPRVATGAGKTNLFDFSVSANTTFLSAEVSGHARVSDQALSLGMGLQIAGGMLAGLASGHPFVDELKKQAFEKLGAGIDFSANLSLRGFPLTHAWGEVGNDLQLNVLGVMVMPAGPLFPFQAPLAGASRSVSGGSLDYSLMAGILPLISPEAISANKGPAQDFPVFGYARAELGAKSLQIGSTKISGIRLGIESSLRLADLISPPAKTSPSLNDYINAAQGVPPSYNPVFSATAYLKARF